MRKNLFLIIGALILSSVASANESKFCEPQAVRAAKVMADRYGFPSGHSLVDGGITEGNDRGVFYVVLSDRIINQNSSKELSFYTVKVSGPHECRVYSVVRGLNP